MTKTQLRKIQNRIKQIKKELLGIGLMRPGSLRKQLNRRLASGKVLEYWQLSYTHKMKSRTEYVRTDRVQTTQDQVDEYKKFKALTEEWIALAIDQAKLTAKLELDEEENS
jgi:hypothetical protein